MGFIAAWCFCFGYGALVGSLFLFLQRRKGKREKEKGKGCGCGCRFYALPSRDLTLGCLKKERESSVWSII